MQARRLSRRTAARRARRNEIKAVPGPRRFWPRRVTAALIKLWQTHSPGQIAKILTIDFDFPVTRNAVIGKIHRVRRAGNYGVIPFKAQIKERVGARV